jgi:HK97 family phage major capsid protein
MRAVTRVQFEQMYGRTIEGISIANDATSIMPIPLSSAIISHMNSAAVMRNICTVVQSPNNQYRMPVFGKSASAMQGEGSVTSGSTGPAPDNILLTKHKNQWTATATDESVEDSDFNIASALIESAGNAIGYTEDVQVCISEGTAPDFTGSIVEGVTDVSEQTDGTLSFASFNKLYYAVPKAYRSGAVIMGGSFVMSLLTGLADPGGNRVLTPITEGAVPIGDGPTSRGTIYGTRVYEVPLTGGTLLIGDPRKYVMLVNPVMSIKQSDVAGWGEDTVHFKVTLREDGILAFADAFRLQLVLTTI